MSVVVFIAMQSWALHFDLQDTQALAEVLLQECITGRSDQRFSSCLAKRHASLEFKQSLSTEFFHLQAAL